jgi:FixJ family two-component response regulator
MFPETTHRPGNHEAPMPLVLIANHDEATRRWMEATLLAAGLGAVSCGSASDLLSHFIPGTPACVILDVVLPDASGLELQRELARDGAAILFVTHERCISSCVRAVKSGAVDFLTLPCDAVQLIHALEHALRQARCAWAEHKQCGELRSRYARLTEREREIFALVASGLLNKQIAQQLSISEITVQIHRGRVMRKMATRSFASLVRMADALHASRSDGSEVVGYMPPGRMQRKIAVPGVAAC